MPIINKFPKGDPGLRAGQCMLFPFDVKFPNGIPEGYKLDVHRETVGSGQISFEPDYNDNNDLNQLYLAIGFSQARTQNSTLEVQLIANTSFKTSSIYNTYVGSVLTASGLSQGIIIFGKSQIVPKGTKINITYDMIYSGFTMTVTITDNAGNILGTKTHTQASQTTSTYLVLLHTYEYGLVI